MTAQHCIAAAAIATVIAGCGERSRTAVAQQRAPVTVQPAPVPSASAVPPSMSACERASRRDIGARLASYGIDAVESPAGEALASETQCERPTAEESYDLLKKLGAELAIYPPALFPRIGLRRVVFCHTLVVSGHDQGGATDGRGGTIFLRANQPAESFDHELGHFLDYRWHRLNKPDRWQLMGFDWRDYEQQKRTRDVCEKARGTDDFLELREDLKGYVSAYATCELEEDVAETFRVMMNAPRWLKLQIRKDPVLRQKAETLRARLREVDGAFGDAFWRKVEADPEPEPTLPECATP